MLTEAEQKKQVRRIFSRLAPVYELLNLVFSMGEDIRWRRFTARALRPGALGRVLDVACGTGQLSLAVAKGPSRPFAVGLDLMRPMLKHAQPKLTKGGGRLAFLAGDVLRLPFPDAAFDAVTIGFGIRNVPRRVEGMAEMRRVLAPGGRIYVLEFGPPQAWWLKAVYKPYLSLVLPRLAALISPDPKAFQYLADTVLNFPTPVEFRAEMRAAGYAATRSLPLSHGIAWMHIGEKPPA